jgi:hypothetical protein
LWLILVNEWSEGRADEKAAPIGAPGLGLASLLLGAVRVSF